MPVSDGGVAPSPDMVCDAVDFSRCLEGVDLVITGEGSLDGLSGFGKVPVRVAAAARNMGIPVVAIVGGRGPGCDAVHTHGIDAVLPVPDPPMSLAGAMEDTGTLVTEAAATLARLLKLGNYMLFRRRKGSGLQRPWRGDTRPLTH